MTNPPSTYITQYISHRFHTWRHSAGTLRPPTDTVNRNPGAPPRPWFFSSLPFPTRRRKGERPSYIDHLIYSHNDLVESVEIGYCPNSIIGDRQYPDHNPLITHLSTPKSIFHPNDIITYKWHKVSDETWAEIIKYLEDNVTPEWLSNTYKADTIMNRLQ